MESNEALYRMFRETMLVHSHIRIGVSSLWS